MDRKQLQERIRKFVAKKLKEESGFATGTGFQHTGKKPQNEEAKKDIPKPAKQYKGPTLQKAPRKQSQQPAVFSKGAKDLSTYERMGYRRVKPSEMIDAKYMWSGRAGKKKENILPIGENTEPLNETRYSQFKKQTEIVKPSSQMHEAMKEIKSRLQEVNKIAKYTSQLKAELSETNDIQYKKRTEEMLGKLKEEVISLYKNIKNLKNG